MPLEIPFSVRITNPQSVDYKYLSGGTTPYISVADANANIPEPIRHTGLTANINGVEYWYKDGILDGNLVEKTTSTEPTNVSGERIEKYIEQANSFSVGDVVGWTGDSSGGYSPAIATTGYTGEVHGMVSEASSTGFTVVYAGYVTGITAAGLTTNKTYFLSDTLAGKLTDTAPTTNGSVIKPIFTTQDSSTAGLVFQYVGFAVTTGVTGGGSSGVTTGINYGGGEEIFSGVTASGTTMQFRTLVGTGGTEVNTVGDVIYISGGSSSKNVQVWTTSDTITDEDVIAFSGVSGTSYNVTLPATPILGREITISDVSGNADTSTISILGGSESILDVTAIINTAFGSITIMWMGVGWKVTSFVN